MHRIPTRLLAFAFALAACADDPTGTDGPAGGNALRAEAVVIETEVGPRADQDPWIECTFTLSATYAGRGADAVVTGAVLRFHAGPDRSEPLDSTVIGGTDMRVAFGGTNVLAPGETLTSAWYFRAGVPFEITGAIIWAHPHEDDRRAAPFEFVCGPDLHDARPPVLSNVSISTIDQVAAGTMMNVRFDASSELGLWGTWVLVESPSGIDTLRASESLRSTTSRTFSFRHPIGTPVGTRLRVHVIAFDAWLRTSAPHVLTSPALYDDVDPLVNAYWIDFDHHICTARACQIADDSSIAFHVAAGDEGGLAHAYLELGEPVVWRDSTAIDVWLDRPRFTKPLAGMNGIYRVRGAITDVAGNRVDVDMGVLNVYHAMGPETSTELLLPWTYRVFPDFASGVLYLVDPYGPVFVHDIGTLARIGELSGPGATAGADLTRDGTLALVHAGGDTITVGYGSATIDTLTVDTAALGTGWQIGEIVTTSAGTIIAALRNADDVTVVELDRATGASHTVLQRFGVTQFDAMRLGRSGDGSRVLLHQLSGCTRLYDVGSRVLGECVTMSTLPSGDQTGQRWATSSVLYDAALAPIGALDRESGFPAVPGADASTYVATRRGLLRYDDATGLIQESRPADEYMPSSGYGATLHLSPDNSIAVIAGRPWSGVGTNQMLITVVRLD